MFDLIIRGGDVVTPQGVVGGDVAVADGTIVAIAASGTLAAESAKRVIDASGHIVMPGGIDPHVHMHHVWIKPDGTPLITAGPEHVGRAALFGGTTTLIDFAFWRDGVTAHQAIEARDKDFVGNSPCDWAYHIMLHTEPPPEFSGQLAEAIQAGYPTLKIFTTNILPSRSGRMVDFGDIWEAFQVLAKHGGLGVIHAEDNDIVMHMYAKLIRENRVGFEHLAEVHNQLSEDLSFRRILRLAESVPGTALYMMHVSAATGVAAIAEARRKGLPIYGETLHQYLLYSANDYKRPNGQIYHTYPSLKSADDQKALWHGTANDVIHCVATDELCCTLKDKTLGNRIDNTTGGNSGVEPRLGVMYTEMVARRGYSLSRYVDLVSSNAAKIMGLYPRKGAIAVGSDADIAILDPTRRGKVRAADLHESDYSPWEGHDIFAWPVVTILRGKVMVENGRVLRQPERRPLSQAQDLAQHPERGDALSEVPSDLVRELLAQSLIAWRVAGTVEPAGDGAPGDCRQSQIHPDRSGVARFDVPVDGHGRWPQASGDFSGGGAAPGQGGARSRLRGKPRACCGRSAGAVMSADVIPVSVLTGFLGSGKTTMLRHLLGQPEFSRTAVIINEFGEIGLDHELIEASEDSFIELRTGCLCCKIRTDLARTLQDMLQRRDDGRCAAFDRIVIETSGLADPAPILQTLMTDADIAGRLVLGNVVTTVDAVNGIGTIEREAISQKQVAVADRIVLTKLDLAGARRACAAPPS